MAVDQTQRGRVNLAGPLLPIAQRRDPPAALSILRFCADHGISRSTFYNLRKSGEAQS